MKKTMDLTPLSKINLNGDLGRFQPKFIYINGKYHQCLGFSYRSNDYIKVSSVKQILQGKIKKNVSTYSIWGTIYDTFKITFNSRGIQIGCQKIPMSVVNKLKVIFGINSVPVVKKLPLTSFNSDELNDISLRREQLYNGKYVQTIFFPSREEYVLLDDIIKALQNPKKTIIITYHSNLNNKLVKNMSRIISRYDGVIYKVGCQRISLPVIQKLKNYFKIK